MLYSVTDTESYITEFTLGYQKKNKMMVVVCQRSNYGAYTKSRKKQRSEGSHSSRHCSRPRHIIQFQGQM